MEEKSTIDARRNLEQNHIDVIVFTPHIAIVVQFLKHEIRRITDRIGRKSETIAQHVSVLIAQRGK